MILMLIGVLGFEAQAYYVLFTPGDYRLILWIISLCVTLFFLVMTLASLVSDSDDQAPDSDDQAPDSNDQAPDSAEINDQAPDSDGTQSLPQISTNDS